MQKKPSACLFCTIIRGEQSVYIVYEGKYTIAFLDHRPLFPGHCLLVPRDHYETLGDLPPALVGPVFSDVKMLTLAVEKALAADGSFVAMNNRVSQSVPHLHVHIVPRRKKDGLKGFFWPRQPYKDEEAMQLVRDGIKAAVQLVQSEESR